MSFDRAGRPTDPSSFRHGNFDSMDFGEIDRDLGWKEPGDDDADAAQIAAMLLGESLVSVFCHILGKGDRFDTKAIGTRFVAVVHELRPDLLGSHSGAVLASQLGVTRAMISKVGCELRDKMGRLSSAGLSDAVRATFARRARLVHARKYATPEARRKRYLTKEKPALLAAKARA